jgi:flagellar export protein FliJ
MSREKKLQVITGITRREQDKLSVELKQINQVLEKRQQQLTLLKQYQQEYMQQRSMLRSVTSLQVKSFEEFLHYINQSVSNEEAELEKIDRLKTQCIQKLNKVTSKIKAYEKIIKKIEIEKLSQAQKKEQKTQDELAQNWFLKKGESDGR